MPSLAAGPTHSPVHWVPGFFLGGIRARGGGEVNHSPSSSAEVKMSGAVPLLPLYTFMESLGEKSHLYLYHQVSRSWDTAGLCFQVAHQSKMERWSL
jgi:hypothetical protein